MSEGSGRFQNPKYPRTETVEEERALRRQRLAVALRVFARFGYDDGVAGHLTVRDPGTADMFWVNPVGIDFAQVRARDLLLVDAEGTVVEGDARVHVAAFSIHAAVHAARPDVTAACHAHSLSGRAWSTLGRLLDPLTQDACAFFEDHALYDHFNGAVDNGEEAKHLGAALGDAKGLILQNHGLLTVGTSVDAAAWWFVSMDRCCRVQLDAEAAGTPRRIPDDVARLTRDQVGNERWGRFSFAPLYSRVVRHDPEVLD